MRTDTFQPLVMDGAYAMGYGSYHHASAAAAYDAGGAAVAVHAASAAGFDIHPRPHPQPTATIFKAPVLQQQQPAPHPSDAVHISVECGTLTGVFLVPNPRVLIGVGTASEREVSPTEFERLGGKAASKKWRTSIRIQESACCFVGGWGLSGWGEAG